MNETENKTVQHKQLQLNQQQVSHIVAGALLLAFFIFIAGYYWGKKSVLTSMTEQLKHESLADRVHSAFYGLEEREEQKMPQDQESDGSQISAQPTGSQASAVTVNETVYYAQLAGFRSRKAADMYIKNLKKYTNEVRVLERKSKSAKGKVTYWYQVVTHTFAHKSKVLELVNQIKKVVPLKHNVIIVALNNKQQQEEKERPA